MREKMRYALAAVLAFMGTLSAVCITVPITGEAAAKTMAVSKSVTLGESKTVTTKDTIKSVKSSKRSILSAKKISSKKFKVASGYQYGSAVITVKFQNGKTTKYNYSVGKYSVKKGKRKTETAKYAIKSVKSGNAKIATVKKISSKKFRVTAKKAGTAKITVKFKNGKKAVYYFKVTGSSGSSGNKNTNDNSKDNNTTSGSEKVSLSNASLKMNEGDTAVLKVSIPSTYSNDSIVFWTCDNTDVVSLRGMSLTDQEKMKTVTVKAVGGGSAVITAICMLHTQEVQVSCKVTVDESKKSASISGFKVMTWSNTSTFKEEGCYSREEDGTNTYQIKFYCNGSEYWINQNVTFTVEDVTSKALVNVFSDMRVGYQAPAVSEIESVASELREWNEKEGQKNWVPITFQEPFTSKGPGNQFVEAISGKKLTIRAGMSTRVVKVVAKQGNKVLDYIYLSSNGMNREGAYTNQATYSSQDEKIYHAVLDKVKQALWQPGMTNIDKLAALSQYINSTNHYPGLDPASKEYNPTFWGNWSIDDTYLGSYGSIINKIMIFQGGYCDCTAARILMEVARDELGIKVFNQEPESGEGVWIAAGAESSNPSSQSHVSLGYKKPGETQVYLFDAGGMTASHSNPYTAENVTCEQHKCGEKLVSLK